MRRADKREGRINKLFGKTCLTSFFFNDLHEMLVYVDVFSKTEYLPSLADFKKLRNLLGYKNRIRWKSTNFELSRYAEFAPFTLSCLALTFFTDFLCFSNISITWKCQHHSLHNLKQLKIFTKKKIQTSSPKFEMSTSSSSIPLLWQKCYPCQTGLLANHSDGNALNSGHWYYTQSFS